MPPLVRLARDSKVDKQKYLTLKGLPSHLSSFYAFALMILLTGLHKLFNTAI